MCILSVYIVHGYNRIKYSNTKYVCFLQCCKNSKAKQKEYEWEINRAVPTCSWNELLLNDYYKSRKN